MNPYKILTRLNRFFKNGIVSFMAERVLPKDSGEGLIVTSEGSFQELTDYPSDIDRDLDDNHWIRVAVQENVIDQQVLNDQDYQRFLHRLR